MHPAAQARIKFLSIVCEYAVCYLLPGPLAPPGFPAPLGILEPDGLSTEAGRAPRALLQSGLAPCIFFTPEPFAP